MQSYSSVNDERTRILRMVEEGRLTAEQAISLLENLGRAPAPRPGQVPLDDAAGDFAGMDEPVSGPPAPEPPAAPLPPEPPLSANGGNGPRWFRVRVTDLASGRSKVSVNIPFRLAAWGMRVGSHFSPEIGNVKLEELSEMLQQDGLQGRLIDVVDEEDGEHVEIFVE